MKKPVHMILLLILSILVLSSCKKSHLDLKHITEIDVVPTAFLDAPNIAYFSEGAKTLGILLENFYSTTPITDYTSVGDFTLQLHYKDGTSRSFILDLNTKGKKAYLTEAEKTYVLEEPLFTKIIDSPFFMPYMTPHYSAPNVQFIMGEKSLGLSGNSTFSYLWLSNDRISEAMEFTGDTVQPIILDPTKKSTLTYTSDPSPTKVTEQIYKNSELMDTYNLLDGNLILPEEEGDFSIKLDFEWDSVATDYFEGSSTYELFIQNDLPVIFSVTTPAATLGDCFVLIAKNVNPDQTLTLAAPFYDQSSIVFYPYEDAQIGILPVDTSVTPGDHTLIATVTSTNGTSQSTDLSVSVLSKDFTLQYLTVSEETLALRSQDNINSDTTLLAEAQSSTEPQKLWNGTFIQPVKGIVSTEFSEIRYTNDNPVPTRHSGIDFAAPRGAPVKASNNGIVSLAMTLYITGNTVVIDHGMGVFTTYCHLDEMDVAVGDVLKKGDIVGKVGTTGFSTGPHLHFTFCINSTYVNPWTFFATDLLDF
ncbi:MAG: M23 family metallopeptidase [Vallitaleaceae bacterium]|nr:M23 family metallopeptidase [Vallitaleaceae bacterium]